MVTGIGYCARRGKRKREKQLRELCENPEKFHFYQKVVKKGSKINIIGKNGKKTIMRR